MIKIKEAIVVEGRYDKNKLSQIVDTMILETGGFGIFLSLIHISQRRDSRFKFSPVAVSLC